MEPSKPDQSQSVENNQLVEKSQVVEKRQPVEIKDIRVTRVTSSLRDRIRLANMARFRRNPQPGSEMQWWERNPKTSTRKK
jgi:hypothetical protein